MMIINTVSSQIQLNQINVKRTVGIIPIKGTEVIAKIVRIPRIRKGMMIKNHEMTRKDPKIVKGEKINRVKKTKQLMTEVIEIIMNEKTGNSLFCKNYNT